MKIKTIDINAKEWFDKVNGNSYFSAVITLNYGMKDTKTINTPFQYGYGDYYVDEAKATLTQHNYISPVHMQPLWRYCEENNIIIRTNKQEGCKKKDVVNFVS
ncbi:hypothetical protein [uncultured Mediterranean phage]|nr:hypothetical protein [uncultured Mediterranean phage]